MQQCIADALDAFEGAVSRWPRRGRDADVQALVPHPAPGPKAKLTAAQKISIPEFLWHEPESNGFRNEVSTCAPIVRVIEEKFGVRYHKDRVTGNAEVCFPRRRLRFGANGHSLIAPVPSTLAIWGADAVTVEKPGAVIPNAVIVPKPLSILALRQQIG